MKKLVLFAGGCSLGFALLGGGLWSYLKTAGQRVVDAAKDSVPIEFEIDRARGMVTDLLPEIRKNMQIIAREEIEVERLDGQLAETSGKLANSKQDILRLKGDLEQPRVRYVYGGKEYSAVQVQQDLASRFARHKTMRANYESLCAIKDARQQSLAAARQKLDHVLEMKRRLGTDVEQLEARLRLHEVAQTTSNMQLDATQLGQARKLVDDIRTRLDVAERVLNAESQAFNEIELDQPQTETVIQDIADYFENDRIGVTNSVASTQGD